MAHAIYQVERVFTEEFDRCLNLINGETSKSIRELLLSESPPGEATEADLQDTAQVQPALFVVSYALARQLMHWGIKAEAMIGHSIGEYAAACLAGVMDLEDALRLVVLRGRLMGGLPAGAMLAAPLSEAETRRLLGDFSRLSLAAVNGPGLTTVSGNRKSIEGLELALTAKGISSKRLRVSHAFHSEMMQPILKEFSEAVRKITLRSPEIPYISNLTGTFITKGQATDPDYYAQHLRETVRFYQGIAELHSEPDRVFLEIGPSGMVKGAIASQTNGSGHATVIETMQRPARAVAGSGLIDTLARLWVCGAEINWDAVHEGARRNRIPLPTYPFERQRYWIEPAESPFPASASAVARRTDISEYFYRQAWKRSPLPRKSSDAAAAGAAPSRILLFADGYGVSEKFSALCKDMGASCTVVRAGRAFEHASSGEYFMNPLDRDSYVKLLKELRARQHLPDLILHCWNESLVSVEDRELLGYTSLVYLAQAVGEAAETQTIKILAITNQMHDVVGNESINHKAAAVQGPCAVIPLEYPELTCRTIDLELPVAEEIAQDLWNDAVSGSNDRTVAYRNGVRWVCEIEAIKLDPEALAQPLVQRDGAYLISGGLGDIEFDLVKHLADLGARRFVLIGLPQLAGDASWDDISRAEADGFAGIIIDRLKLLRSMGLEILADSADVASRDEMKGVLGRAAERFTRINGVVHTAFATEGGMIQLKSPEGSARVMAPKVSGTEVLEALLRDQPLSFFVVFSSTLSLTGVFGQCDYCGANSYAAAFVEAQRARNGSNSVAIHWDVTSWERWQEDAMTAAPELLAEIREARERFGISTSDAVRCFDIALALNVPQVIVSTRDFREVVNNRIAAQSALLSKLAAIGRGRENISSDYVPPTGEVELAIAGIWQDLFGINQIGAKDDFFGIGGNSLVAIQAISRLRREFDVDLPMSALFEHPTVSSLAAAILETRSEADEMLEMEQLLAEIEGLSPEQVRAALADEQPETGD
jgi:acyl transferase domain-containing protein/acyl carrier protein